MGQGECWKTMERIRTEEEDEEDEAEEPFPFLLKDWRDSCLVIASITEAGMFTGNKKQKWSCQDFCSFIERIFDFDIIHQQQSAVLPEFRLRRNPRSRRVFKGLTCGHESVKIYCTQRWTAFHPQLAS